MLGHDGRGGAALGTADLVAGLLAAAEMIDAGVGIGRGRAATNGLGAGMKDLDRARYCGYWNGLWSCECMGENGFA